MNKKSNHKLMVFELIKKVVLVSLVFASQSGAQPPNGNSDPASVSGAYTISNGSAVLTDTLINSSTQDQSGVLVKNGASLTMSKSTVSTTGNTSSQDNSSFYGQNAGVVANTKGTLILTDCSIKTTGTGANGVFATDSGTTITMTNDTVNCGADGGHGIDATFAGKMVVNKCIITTAGAHGAAISTDRGGGTIIITGGMYVSSGQDSPGIYCTGDITCSDAKITGAGSEGFVIEGANNIILNNCALTGAKGTRDRGALIYQSMSGDATGNHGTFTMTGGSFTWPSATGPMFYFTNATGSVNLKNVKLVNSSPVLFKAAADNWGNSGSNGGQAIITVDSQNLAGNIIADNISSVTLTLSNHSTLTGSIDSAKTAKKITITLDETSSWTVTGTSHVTSLSGATISGTSVTNITGNGNLVYYTTALSSSLLGKTYSLSGGGSLLPEGSTVGIMQPAKHLNEITGSHAFKTVGRVYLDNVYEGKEIVVTIYDLTGKRIGGKALKKNVIDLQKDFMVSNKTCIVKITSVK